MIQLILMDCLNETGDLKVKEYILGNIQNQDKRKKKSL